MLFFFHKTVTVDKTLKRVIIKKDSILKPLNSSKKIPFSDIKEIRIEHYTAETEYWEIFLIKNNGKYEPIFVSESPYDSESRIKEIADKIGIFAGKEITFKNY